MMRARFPKIPNMPLGIAAVVAVALTVTAFTALHRTVGGGGGERFAVQYAPPLPVADKVEGAAVMARAINADAAPAGAAQTLEAGFVPPPPRRGPGRGPSQLIRTANVSLEVADVEKALRTATALTDEQLGDVIGLNDDSPTTENAPHTATMQIRVPQYRFEQMLQALGTLGKVRAKSVNAQDVSDQIVDAQARLRNLRRTEADILNIMDRSGNIEQVLNVTQQLGGVRDQIERLDAQIQSMQYQVSYSTINITLTSPVVVTTPTGLGLLAVAWKNATLAARDLGVSLASLVLWLVAFSPYLLVLALLVGLVLNRVRAHAARGADAAA